MPIFASNIVVTGKQEMSLNVSESALHVTTEQKIAKEKERIQKEKQQALEILKNTEERQANLEDEQKNNLKFFKRSSEETIDTLIIDRSSNYVADIVR